MTDEKNMYIKVWGIPAVSLNNLNTEVAHNRSQESNNSLRGI